MDVLLCGTRHGACCTALATLRRVEHPARDAASAIPRPPRLCAMDACFRRPLAATRLECPPPPPLLALLNPFLLPSSLLWQRINKIGPEGAGKLAGALEKMTGMQTLDLVRRQGGECDCVRACVRACVLVRLCLYVCVCACV